MYRLVLFERSRRHDSLDRWISAGRLCAQLTRHLTSCRHRSRFGDFHFVASRLPTGVMDDAVNALSKEYCRRCLLPRTGDKDEESRHVDVVACNAHMRVMFVSEA